MTRAYTLAFSHRDGRLELDDGVGMRGGLRTVDPIAREFRYADGRAIPFDAIAAVAIVYTEKEVARHSRNSMTPTMVREMQHSIVLVPRALPEEARALLDAIARGTLPANASLRIASVTVEDASIYFMLGRGSAAARREAKAIAATAGLPAFELYGESPVFRPAGGQDLSLVEALRARAAAADPGPPPPWLTVTETADELVIAPAVRKSTRLPFALMGLGSIVIGILLIAFADPRPGLFALVPGVIILIVALNTPPPRAARLVVGPTAIEWTGESGEDRVELAALEMIRVADDGALVLVGHRDEVRCALGGEAASWARQAIERRLSPREGTYR